MSILIYTQVTGVYMRIAKDTNLIPTEIQDLVLLYIEERGQIEPADLNIEYIQEACSAMIAKHGAAIIDDCSCALHWEYRNLIRDRISEILEAAAAAKEQLRLAALEFVKAKVESGERQSLAKIAKGEANLAFEKFVFQMEQADRQNILVEVDGKYWFADKEGVTEIEE
jgi:hypothetical protein